MAQRPPPRYASVFSTSMAYSRTFGNVINSDSVIVSDQFLDPSTVSRINR